MSPSPQLRRHNALAAAGTRVRCLGTACCSHEAPVGPRVPAQLQSGFCQETPLPSIPTLALRAETCPVEGEQPLNACSFTVALEFCMMFRTMVFFFSQCSSQGLCPFFFFLRLLFFSLYLFICLAVLGLRCCAQAFSSCGDQGLLSSCSVRASLVAARGL